MNTVDYSKLLITIRYRLQGLAQLDARYYTALRALAFFEDLHGEEKSKSGTKGFYHQLNILSFTMTQHANLANPYNVYTQILGHDGVEDYQEKVNVIRSEFPDDYRRFEIMSKYRDGVRISDEQYFSEIERDIDASVSKGMDRIHNYSRMAGVFSVKKQAAYCKEGEDFFLPMLKAARRRFPQQEAVYELMKSMLSVQMDATKHLLAALEKNPHHDTDKAK